MASDSNAFHIRAAETAEDGRLLIALIRKLADFERLVGPDDDAAARMIEHGFACTPPKFEALLAIDESVADAPGGAIGYALYFETYSTFVGKPSLYLEDLFVLPDQRGRGVGKALLMRCIETASARDYGRLEWSVLDWNTEAQRFYKSLGAEHLSEWHLYRLTEDSIRNLVADEG